VLRGDLDSTACVRPRSQSGSSPNPTPPSQARQAEEEIADILGSRQVAQLRDALEALIPKLDDGSPPPKKSS
jgi:hypothetical protein